uniref:Rpp4C3 n=1 Tax=Phaseolus vulgaris TaxID=3885 RepID=G8DCX6_PHAVU|nr:Rpp4C3 [Phaseolus vulgaris]
METVISTTTESALQIGGGLVKRHVGYFYNYNEKLQELNNYIVMLNDARQRVQNEAKKAEMNAEEIENDVHNWLKHVDEKIKKYVSFIDDERHSKISSIGFFPNNLQLRYRLGRKATKIIEEIKADEHFKKKFDRVSYRVFPTVDSALANTGYESFGSRNKTFEMIMKTLEDSKTNIVGVYGVGGVGKTTLVKAIAKKVQEKKLFNMVVMANITRNPDIKNIQGQIAEMLGMRMEEESETLRADLIRKRLQNEKENTLIILDDLWDGLDLNKLGIPSSYDVDDNQWDVKDISDFGYNKREKEDMSIDSSKMKKDKLYANSNKVKKEKAPMDHKRCKILLTSRSKEVICNQMDVQDQSTFLVGVIDEKEAETLLKKVAGIHSTNSMFDKKVTEIAKMCAGLPIALVSIGRALKNKSAFVWEDVYRQIKRQSFTEERESIEFSVKLSYDHLKNDELKCLFLQCARMGNDALIMDLVKFCIGSGLLQGVFTIREARHRVNALIEVLKDSSLLVESYSTDRFNMHDIVRNVALSISSKEKHVLFMKNGIVDEWPNKDELKRYTAIFLQYCDFNDELPDSIDCPGLQVLHIDSKDDSIKIPDNFFKDMIELRVLILTGVNLSLLPSSLKCLTKLRMLSLERCSLEKKLSYIGALKKLRILTLSGSNIVRLPLEFGQLDKLQLFDLSNCPKLRIIRPNIISRMKVLEEFYMRDYSIPRKPAKNIKSLNATLSELMQLNWLRTLDIHIPRVANFPQNMFFDKLDSYKIVIGDLNMLSQLEFKVLDKYEAGKFLALNLRGHCINIHSEKWIKMLFKNVEHLLLGDLNDVDDVLYEFNVEGFANLKHMYVVNSFGIQFIIKSVERFHPLLAFPKLESMCLYKLDNLEKICDNKLTKDSFRRLKIIKIKTCDQLKNIFSFSMIECFGMVERIEACDCNSLKEIVSIEGESSNDNAIEADKVEFPQLRFLTLQSLPSFCCLYTNNKTPFISQSFEDQVPNKELKQITTVSGQYNNGFLSLFNEKVSIPKLEWLELSSINIRQIWNDQCFHSFQNLLKLNVSDCENLKYLLSFPTAGSLVNLQSLFVSGCELMEDIFSTTDATQNIDIFPKLKEMEINCMKKLNTIWQPHMGFNSFHCLDSLIVRECDKLVTIFPNYIGKRFQSLQSLVITDCTSVETIFDFRNIPETCGRSDLNLHDVLLKRLPNLVHIWKLDTDEVLNFNNLQSIVVYKSKMLEYLFPLSVAKGLEKLETLDVSNCWEIKEIVACNNRSNEEAFRFPQLHTLSLQHLFELRSFYRGTHSLEWPLLRKLSLLVCSNLEETTNSQMNRILLATEKVIHNLEYMSISWKEAEWLQLYIVSVHRMHRLKSLVLSGLKNTEIVFWLLNRLPNLESLTLMNCLVKEFWASTNPVTDAKIGVVVQLKELMFNNVWFLQNIGFKHCPLLQRVERLVVSGCGKLKSLMPHMASFSYLTYLEVTDCLGLLNLMTSSTAKSLVQLVTLKVSFCESMEIIVQQEEQQVIEFRQLKAIELVSLESLTCFCSSKKCLKFPSLENLLVTDCPKMKTFCEKQSAPSLRKVHVAAGEKDTWYWEGNLNATLRKISTGQVSYEDSKELTLTEDSHQNIWSKKAVFPYKYFGNLKKLVVEDIKKKESVIPSKILACLKSLEELEVYGCEKAKVVFDIHDIEMNKTNGMVSRLKKLDLDELPNLTRVWNKNPQGIVSFPYLQEVIVSDCSGITTLFPSPLVRNLVNLQKLEILRCKSLVEIVGKEDETELGTAEMFHFPYLSFFILYKLPKLSCFYPGKHHLECPILETLDVSYCPMLKLFTSKFSDKEAVRESEVSAPNTISQLQQPLFSVEKVVPKLKNLTLNEENIILLRDGHGPPHLLCNLNKLDLSYENVDRKEKTLPFDLLKVPSLQRLEVRHCFGLKEIFPSQKLEVHDGKLPELKRLTLVKLHDLESIGLEHPWVKPFSVTLKKLTVRLCDKIHYLFTFSTAESLVQLEFLCIEKCDLIREIVKKEDEDASAEIKFRRLTTLELVSLPKLASFYSGKTTLQFSRLKTVTVDECPNMITFSEGTINAPMFQGIETSIYYSNLTFLNDLNTTVQWLFVKKEDPKMKEFWHDKAALQDSYFQSVKTLVVENIIENFKISSGILRVLRSLEELQVHSCKAVQVIFNIDETMEKNGIVSPLKKLTLDKLPYLKRVWSKDPQGMINFPNLQEVSVRDCKQLETLFHSSLAKNLLKLGTLDIRNCAELVSIVRKEDAMEEEATARFEFPCLSSLLLYKLPQLSCFYPGKHHLKCPILESLNVSYCPKLKLFTFEFLDSDTKEITESKVSYPDTTENEVSSPDTNRQPLFSVEKVVPKLKKLALNEENIKLLRNKYFPEDLFDKLNYLELCFEDCDNDDDKNDGDSDDGDSVNDNSEDGESEDGGSNDDDSDDGDSVADDSDDSDSDDDGDSVANDSDDSVSDDDSDSDDDGDSKYGDSEDGDSEDSDSDDGDNKDSDSDDGDSEDGNNVDDDSDNDDDNEDGDSKDGDSKDDDNEDDYSEEDTLPFDFLHKVHNLEHLVVRCLRIKKIFPAQEHQVKERIPTTLKSLTLGNLEELKSIGLEHPPYSEKLEVLNLERCPQLQNLVPNSVSFISLKQLCVKLCQEMTYLFKFSTAKSLVQLESLIVMNCKSLKEIAEKEDNDDEIIFGKLTTLTLDSLPRLEGFYLGKATLQFSCLKEMKIAKCRKMDKFSIGVAKAPMIPHVNFQNNPSLIHDDDLNNIVNRLFTKR